MRATINGIAMNYAVSGAKAGLPVVLHHPLATDLTFWDELTAVLEPDYRVIRFDARGHGRTDAPSGRYDFKTLCGDVVGLMDHVGIKQAGYVGLSMGGMVGQYLGLDHADRFSCLVLVSTSSRVPPEGRAMWAQRIADAREKGMGSQVETALGRWITAKSRAARPDLVQRFTRMIEATPVDGYAGWGGAIADLDVTDRLNTIAIPTRVIVGDEDVGTPPAAAEVIANNIPGAELIVMKGVAHQLSAEDPKTFHGHVLPFLEAFDGAV